MEKNKLINSATEYFDGNRFMSIDDCQGCLQYCEQVLKKSPSNETCDKCMGQNPFPRR